MNISDVLLERYDATRLLRLRVAALAAGDSRRAALRDVRPVTSMGLRFPASVGMAAGFDRYGDFAHHAHAVGLGFVETGTVTPLPEPGHNRGVGVLIAKLERHGWGRRDDCAAQRSRLGISIASNSSTPPSRIHQDYRVCMRQGWRFADYFTINIGFMFSAFGDNCQTLVALLAQLKDEQLRLAQRTGGYAPIVLKLILKKDESLDGNLYLAERVREIGFDGILAVFPDSECDRTASGRNLRLAMVQQLVRIGCERLAVLTVGGIRNARDARERFEAGAALVQIHRGLISPGPSLVREINGVRDVR